MEYWTRMIGVGLVALVSILYMLELDPRHEDGLVELSNNQVVMIAQCQAVFSFVGELSNYAQWFPGIDNVTALEPGPMRNGKKYEEIVSLPIYGDYARHIFVSSYLPPSEMQFMYEDMSMVAVTIKISQQTPERCIMDLSAATRRTSFLYHLFVGVPLRVMYSLRSRHALFAVRSMFNQAQGRT